MENFHNYLISKFQKLPRKQLESCITTVLENYYEDQQQEIKDYVSRLAQSIITNTQEKFPRLKINSAFLAHLFNTIAKTANREIVDPNRGGTSLQFGSTRDTKTKETKELRRDWMDITGDKTKYTFNLLLYFMKYTNDIEKSKELIRRSMNFSTLAPAYKSAVQKAINKATTWYNEGNRQSF